MRLVLMRHADKLRSQVDPDVDLSASGIEQSARLPLASGRNFPTPDRIHCSPKKRAISTVHPLCKHLKLKAEIREDLDEQHLNESRTEFEFRIKSYLDEVSKLPLTVLLCSHADWLASVVRLMPSTLPDPDYETHFHTAQFRMFEFDGVLWHYSPHYESKC